MMRYFLLGILSLILPLTTKAATKKLDVGNINVKYESPKVPSLESLGLESKIGDNEQVAKKADENKRKPSSESKAKIGSEQMLSKSFKEFRDTLLEQREAEGLEKLLGKYNDHISKDPNHPEEDPDYLKLDPDTKYVVARLSPLLAFRGFIWRMSYLAHQSVMSQEMLVSTIRAFGEQIMIFEPDTHWKSYMAFITIPSAKQVKLEKPQFESEGAFINFLAGDVYRALALAAHRLEQMNFKNLDNPVVFDNKIRFGEKSFVSADLYDAQDRFAIIDEAERLAAIARFNKRMSTIWQLAAYNWNGYIALRKAVGKLYGIDAIFEYDAKDIFSIEGVTRYARRTEVESFLNQARVNKDKGLFFLANPQKSGIPNPEMNRALYHFKVYAHYIRETWKLIEADNRDFDTLLDPDLFVGRKKQISIAVQNLYNIANGISVKSAITGEIIKVDLENFFNNPPDDLFKLMPTGFDLNHKDIRKLSKVYKNFNAPANTSKVTMSIGGETVEWRNYLYGRAIEWDAETYGKLFPGVRGGKGVANKIRVLAETRGSRPLLNPLMTFVK